MYITCVMEASMASEMWITSCDSLFITDATTGLFAATYFHSDRGVRKGMRLQPMSGDRSITRCYHKHTNKYIGIFCCSDGLHKAAPLISSLLLNLISV